MSYLDWYPVPSGVARFFPWGRWILKWGVGATVTITITMTYYERLSLMRGSWAHIGATGGFLCHFVWWNLFDWSKFKSCKISLKMPKIHGQQWRCQSSKRWGEYEIENASFWVGAKRAIFVNNRPAIALVANNEQSEKLLVFGHLIHSNNTLA